MSGHRSRWWAPKTVRTRLTLLYVAWFAVSGVLVLAIANVGVRTTARPIEFVRGPGPDFSPLPLPGPDPAIDRFAVSSIVALLIMLVVSIGLGWWIAGRMLRPLRTITASAREISASNLHERLRLDGPDDEITELGATLDDLLDRLEASFDSQRHFVANASHELRTPLTAERALLQVALADPDASAESLRAVCEEVLELGEQQERLISALLTLAIGERGLDRRDPLDLGVIATSVVAARRADAERRDITVDVAIDAAPATGDPQLVERLVANLVDNALRHNLSDAGAGARIEVWTGTAAGRSVVRVGNTGAPVPDDQVQRLLQPFQRLGTERVGGPDGERGGHGLGLAIVAAIADAHGATMAVRPRLSGGLDVEVAFNP